jgi:hypothetical protein
MATHSSSRLARDPEAQPPAQPAERDAAHGHAHGEAAAPRPAQPQKPSAMARHPPTGSPPRKPTQLDDRGSPGELDRDIVRRYIGFHLDQVRHCYEEQRIARPALVGTVHAQFTIAPQGSVATSVAAGLDGEVASCVAGVIKDIAFPRSGVGVQVSYPFHFQPAGDRDEPDHR